METNLTKFMENIKLMNKDLSLYEDLNKGVLFYVNTAQLFTKVENLQLSKEEFTVKKFEGVVDELDYDIIEVDRPISKYSITKKEEDKYIITNSKVKVRNIWNVSNAIGIHKSFNNKEEALELAKEINKNIEPYFN